MRYIRKIPRGRGLNEPILHGDHRRPVTRRELLSAGLITGSASVMMPTLAGLLAPGRARAQTIPNVLTRLDPIIETDGCGITGGAGMVPFIAFDLSGGANIAGSNVLMGRQGGQEDFLSTAGYSRLGLPGNMTPNSPGAVAGTNLVNNEFGALWHSDGAILRGMLASTQPATRANTNGFGIAARSENDTGNNPHNPMYALAIAGTNREGARGSTLTLIGSQNSESGGNFERLP